MTALTYRMCPRRAGFSYLELMIGVVSASILAVTAGTMLIYSALTWQRESQAVDLQRDATVAMAALTRAIRPAAASDIAVTGGNRIDIAQGAASVAYYVEANNLVYNADPAGPGSAVTLAHSVTQFDVAAYAEGVAIELALQNAVESVQIRAVVAHRN